jgi:hypothetical protein
MFNIDFKNISNFSNVSDYLPILNAVIITDIFVILLLLRKLINSSVLKIWYRDFSLGAVIADVLIIFIGIIIARFIYPYIFDKYSLIQFIGLVVVIQVIHDILFYLFVSSVPRGVSKILDVFKDYGKENGITAIISDSAMMISSVLIASYLKGQSLNTNIIVLIVSVYLVPYFIYSI